jgi:hypothetical protein
MEEILKLLSLPESIAFKWFDEGIAPINEMVFTDISMASIKETYSKVTHLGKLTNDITFKTQIRETLFSLKDTEEEMQPIKFHTILFKTSLVPGSQESL